MDISVLIFNVNGALYAINSENIALLTQQYRLENKPKGNTTDKMVCIREQVVPVIDIKNYLFGINNEISDNSILVVCDYESKLFAFETNEIGKLIHINDNDKIQNPEVIKSSRHLIDYYVHKDERLIGILDIQNMKEEAYYDEIEGHIQD